MKMRTGNNPESDPKVDFLFVPNIKQVNQIFKYDF